ncbi:hypothetical protein [uncultured Friedmanniella sp.]|uniref:hypothetical protein n=1 Tax=uncultured Friedmanniella sp. TaxID=335381 RepID=UPI0035CADDA2
MPESVFGWGGAEVALDATGTVTSVRHASAPGAYLSSLGEVEVWTRGGPVTWSSPEVALDVDEVEVVRRSGDLRLVVRHGFAAGWGLRVTLVNAGSAPRQLERVQLAWRLPTDRPVWALTAGATGSFAVLPAGGSGPLLGALLRLGAVQHADAAGLEVGPVLLEPGARYVEQWHLDFHASPRAFDRTVAAGVPRRLDIGLDEVVTLTADEDAALVLDEGLHAETVRDRLELTASAAGRYGVETRSARGVTRYEIGVAEPLEATLADAASTLVAGPRTGAGTLRLADVDAALVVQHGLARGLGPDDQIAAEDGLDLFGSRLPEEGPFDPRTVAFLCGEHLRTADPEPLAWATRGVLSAARPEPGLGVAATRVCLARLVAGRSVAPVLDHLRALVAEAAAGPAAGAAPTARRDQAALVELEVVTMPQSGPTPAGLLARTVALGGWLGAGLRGRAVPPLPLDELGHLALVLALLPEPVSVELARRWGAGAHELARRARTEVLVRLGDERADGPDQHVVGPAHGWLVLAAVPT